MKVRFLPLMLAVVLALSACGGESSPASSSSQAEPASSGRELSGLIVDGKFAFASLEDALFTMEYEPASGSVTAQHLGLEFPSTMNTDWVGDQDCVSNYTLYDGTDAPGSEKTQYGTVTISTAPADLAAYYGTDDPAAQLEAMKAHYFPTADVFEGRKKAVVEDFGYELVFAEQAVFEELGWNGFFIEFINQDTNTRSMRFFVCNDEMNEKYYSFAADVDLPADDEALANRYRATLFSLRVMGD